MEKLSVEMLDFLCIGAQKAGTTWLMTNLAAHPQVWTPRFVKELHYFDKLHLGYKRDVMETYRKRGQKMVETKPELAGYFEKVMDPAFAFTDPWYRHVFSVAPRRKKKGECTPLYCALPEAGVRHVHELAPNAAIIYMIRDPYDRAMSSLRMEMDHRNVTDSDKLRPFLKSSLFMARGKYSENIPRWEAVFDRSKILYIPFGDVKADPLGVMRLIESHLGLSNHEGYPRLHDRINNTKSTDKVISEETKEMVRKSVYGEAEFLACHLGEDFANRAR